MRIEPRSCGWSLLPLPSRPCYRFRLERCYGVLIPCLPFQEYINFSIKVNLYSMRFLSVFVRFFSFLLLDKVCAFLSAFFIIILFKNFVYERQERYFKIRLYSFAKDIFRTTFCPVCDSFVSAGTDI